MIRRPIKSNLKRLIAVLLLGVLWLGGCGKPGLDPIEISPEDMCATCKMAISQLQYAAEYIDHEGNAFKFDDIGCMVNYVARAKAGDAIAVFYVRDFDSKTWLKAEEATLVASPNFHTPMSSGIVAFQNRPRAEAAAMANQARLLSLTEVLENEQNRAAGRLAE